MSETKLQDAEEKPAEPIKAQTQTQEELLEAELKAKHEQLLRLAAEYENFKKTSQRELDNRVKFANENLVISLLPTFDNLEQAIKAASLSSDTNTDSLVTGIKMVLKQMADVLAKYGIESFSAQGQMFDPMRHEAVGEREDPEALPGTVVEEYQQGYLLNGRLLRPARVLVAKAKAEVEVKE